MLLADALTGTVYAAVLAFLYFLPSVVAWRRGHLNRDPIILVNLFLGWTVLVWFLCLVWAYSSNTKAQWAMIRGDKR